MDVISKLQLRFLKLILGVKVTTPTCMVLGEVGRYPIEIEAKCRMLGFWYGFCNTSHSESPKISNLMLQLCSKLYYACDYKPPWLMEVHSLLDSVGLSYIWSNQIHKLLQISLFFCACVTHFIERKWTPYLCVDSARAQMNSLFVGWFCTSALGLVLFQMFLRQFMRWRSRNLQSTETLWQGKS